MKKPPKQLKDEEDGGTGEGLPSTEESDKDTPDGRPSNQLVGSPFPAPVGHGTL